MRESGCQGRDGGDHPLDERRGGLVGAGVGDRAVLDLERLDLGGSRLEVQPGGVVLDTGREERSTAVGSTAVAERSSTTSGSPMIAFVTCGWVVCDMRGTSDPDRAAASALQRCPARSRRCAVRLPGAGDGHVTAP
ncbi:hypothetical protein GCM10025875_15360 [Litorihabitans aurantiacus]|uniref:Uncharacterized protein n=1 Tax=Litorihabitans aurantiacus TaxID=1930061 RepID=A0AA37XE51_9MICO|nr:hypothetical protein GCM10025875_15360 [Litorihabitans aurantiacus]